LNNADDEDIVLDRAVKMG